jgi:LPXTG-site transpeptidase (sortase) family protein
MQQQTKKPGRWLAGLLLIGLGLTLLLWQPLSTVSGDGGSSSVRPEVSDLEMFGKELSTSRLQHHAQTDPSTLTPVSGPIVPVRLRIPALNIDTDVEELGLYNGAMDVPTNIWNAGWLKTGVRPGETGNAVIDGHKDSVHGTAIFWELGKLKPGDKIYVSDQGGNELTFEVRQVKSYTLKDIPLDQIFGPSGEKQLNLISCDGRFVRDQHTYDRRVVVYTQLSNSI